MLVIMGSSTRPRPPRPTASSSASFTAADSRDLVAAPSFLLTSGAPGDVRPGTHGRRCSRSSPTCGSAARRARARGAEVSRQRAPARLTQPFISARAASGLPRIEALYGNRRRKTPGSEKRLSTNIARLRRDSRRRPAAGSTTLVTGPSGSGKTTLACSSFRRRHEGEPGCLRVLRTAAPHRDEARTLGLQVADLWSAGRHHALAPATSAPSTHWATFS